MIPQDQAMTPRMNELWRGWMFDFIWMSFLIYMLVNDAIGKHLVEPGVLYVIHKYVYKKTIPLYLGHAPLSNQSLEFVNNNNN